MRLVGLLAALHIFANTVAALSGLEIEFMRVRHDADQGIPSAQHALAGMLHSGNGTTADPALAIQWWQKAAGQGNRDSMKRLGDIFLEASPADPVLAGTWYRLAAEQGQLSAQMALAALLQTDLLGHADLQEAYAWLRLAVEGGAGGSELRRIKDVLTEEQRLSAETIFKTLRERMRVRATQRIARRA